MDFEAALREQCEERGGLKAKKILKVLNMPESKRRTRIIGRLESHARVHLVSEGAVGAEGAIDWGSIDWNKFFTGLIQLLTTLLPLILQFVK